MRILLQDLRYGARMLLKSPAFTLVAVLSLAIGIGANTAIFSVANAILFRSMPFPDVERVVGINGAAGAQRDDFPVSYPSYQYLREHNEVFSGLTCWGELPLSMMRGEEAEQAFGMIVSGNYFSVLGLNAAAGRFFIPEEDQTPGTHPVAVLSYRMWQRRFGGDPSIVGQTLNLNGAPFTIIGVAPENFNSTIPLFAPDMWVPLMMQKQVLPASDLLTSPNAEWLHMVGRLKPGVTLEQARTQMSMLATQLEQAHPELYRAAEGEPEHPTGLGVEIAPVGAFPVRVRGVVIGIIGLLMTVVSLVLLIACANLTSLLLARATARRQEIAVRLALGASRWRIVRQLLTESVLLCLLSGLGGVLIALWMIDLLVAFKPSIPLPINLNFPLDLRVFGWTCGVSLVTGILFGLVPALQASKPDMLGALKGDAGARGSHRSRVRDLFVVGQIAMSLLLLVSAGLFLRALVRARTIFPGAEPEQVLTMTFDPQFQGYDKARAREFYRQLLERVGALPGVESVSLADGIPVGNSYSMTGFDIQGQPTMTGIVTGSPGYLQTLRIPLMRGRDFKDADAEGAPRVAIVDEVLARHFFANEDPIGQHISWDGGPHDSGLQEFEIIGVAGSNSRFFTRSDEPLYGVGGVSYLVYLPSSQPLFDGAARLNLYVRTGRAAQEVFADIRREVAALDSRMPVQNTMPLVEQMNVSLLPQRFMASLAGTFGFIGLLLAAIGIFGMVSYAVAQRTHEIGVRMALGAQEGDVMRMILGHGLKITLLGTGIGLAGAFLVTRLLRGLLYGVSATDPATFVGVSALLIAIALLACYLPARRATKVDPMIALRYE